ncbi:unnamed protein product [Hymenolepis diminuta]|uniref:Uncharacterized protein n=1 Tax=Hymenolepis diminuta TaxID=6216 RepID=A0A564Z5C4_HYMDI|nr:unnamed protein product [Hymenolepis diminuta]
MFSRGLTQERTLVIYQLLRFQPSYFFLNTLPFPSLSHLLVSILVVASLNTFLV